MEEFKHIVSHAYQDYGRVLVKVGPMMDRRKLTRNHLRTLTGVKYDVIDRYYKGERVELVDLDFLAKVCYVLDCKIEDLLEYQPPENVSEQ